MLEGSPNFVISHGIIQFTLYNVQLCQVRLGKKKCSQCTQFLELKTIVVIYIKCFFNTTYTYNIYVSSYMNWHLMSKKC